MTLIKKFAAPLTAVALVAVMAVSLLGQQRRAEAGPLTAVGVFQAPVQAAGLTETWTVNFTPATTVPATTGTITVDFPTGFTTTGASAVTASWGTVTSFSATTNGRIVITNGTTASGTGAVSVTIAGITNPTATTALTAAAVVTPGTAPSTATAGFSVTTSADTTPTATSSTVPQIWNTAATKSPTTSVQADGSSTVLVTFTPSGTATNAGTAAQVVTVSTDIGTQSAALSGTGTASLPTFVAGATQTSGLAVSITATTTIVATVKAPSAAGTSTVILRLTPASGGQAVIIGSTQITWTAATTQGAVAAGSVTPTATTVINSSGAGSTAVLTYTFVDASGNAPIPGATIVCSASLGTLTAPTNGTGTGTQQVTGAIPVGGVFAVTLNGAGLGGTSTVSCVVGTVTVTKTATISGLAASVVVTTNRSNSTAGLIAKGNIRGTDSTTAAEGQDELTLVAVVKDANGNFVGSGNVTFTLTTPAGSTMVLTGTAEQLTITTVACSVSGTGTTICVDAIEAGAGGSVSTPAAVASIDVDSASAFPEPSGTYTITARYTNSDATVISGTATFTVALPVATITFGAIPVIPVGGTASLPFTVADSAGGVPVAGSLVTITVSNTNLLVQDAFGTTGTTGTARTTSTGTGSITLIGVAAGTSTVVANLGTVTKVANVTVGVVEPPVTPPPAGTGFTGGSATVPAGGIDIKFFTGTTAQLSTFGATAKYVSVSATVGGKMYTFVVGAPDFVNAEFNAAFPTGLTSQGVIIRVP